MRIGGDQMNDVSSYRLIVMLGAAGVGVLVLVAVILFLFFAFRSTNDDKFDKPK